jgi:HK97 family phage major capsid protein
MEARAKAFANTGRQSVPVAEARATLISGGKIATPTEVGGINDAFTQVSSIVDMVKVTDCTGMGAYKVAYEIASATAAKHTEGADAAVSDPTFDFVTITPETAAVVSYVSKEVRKQSPLNYAEKVRASALTALRKYAAKLIVTQAKASALTQKMTVTAIAADTLRKLALNYGGELGVEGSAALVLNKANLIKFGDIRGTQEKKPVFEIVPDAGNPNTGMIKDGGLSVKYVLDNNLADTELLYGNLHCFELGLFGDYEIAVSDDAAITKLMLTIVGDVSLGGGVVVKDGLILATIGAA